MKMNLQAVRDADGSEKVAGDLVRKLEAHGIELHEEELEQVIAPDASKFKLV
jgi:hypothetical protein